MVTIREAKTARDRIRFIKLPWSLYRDDPHWVPPLIADQREFLDPQRGVFYEYGQAALFVAWQDGRPVGRISAHVNPLHEQRFHDGKGFFGFFECADDPLIARGLLETAEDWLRDREKSVCEGPLSFGIYDEVGILVSGFDSDPYVLNVHNREYYGRLIEGAGYEKSVDWYAFRGIVSDYETFDRKLFKLRDRALGAEDVAFRTIDMGRIDEEAEVIKALFHAAWDANWGHVPFSDGEFRRLKEALKRIVVPELTIIAEVGGKPVGLALTLFDANEAVKGLNGRLWPFGFIRLIRNMKRTDRFRQFAMGVLEEYRSRGLEIALYMTVAERAHAMGFREAEMSLIVETNQPMLRVLDHLPVERYKTYRIFRKAL